MNHQSKIEIEVKLSNKDIWHYAVNRYFEINNAMLLFLGFTIFGLSLVFLFLRGSVTFPHIIDTLLTAGLFTIIYLSVMTYLSASNTEKLCDSLYRYVFTDDEVVVGCDSYKTIIKWNYFIRAKENAKYFVLYMKSGDPQLIPKRYLQKDEIIDFKNLLRTKFGNEAYLKKSKESLGLK